MTRKNCDPERHGEYILYTLKIKTECHRETDRGKYERIEGGRGGSERKRKKTDRKRENREEGEKRSVS